MNSERISSFLRDAWGALVGLEEAASVLSGETEAARDALASVGHRLTKAAERWHFPRLAELGSSLERLGSHFPPNDHASFEDASQLIGDTLNVLPMVFDNIASEGRDDIPQLDGLQWRFDSEVPAAEALSAQRVAAAAPGEIDRALEAFRRQDPEALSFFGPEAEEHAESLRLCLARLESFPADSEALRDMFRHAHTIKGAAYTVGCEPIGHLTHGLEDLLGDVHRRRRHLGAAELDFCSQCIDLCTEMLGRLGGQVGPPLQPAYDEVFERLRELGDAAKAASPIPPQPPGATPPAADLPAAASSPAGPGPGDLEFATDALGASPSPAMDPSSHARLEGPPEGLRASAPPPAEPEPDAGTQAAAFKPTLRVELARVDQLLDEAGEVVVARRRLERTLDQLESLGDHVLAVRRRLLGPGDGARQLDEIAADLSEIGQDVKGLASQVENHMGTLGKRTRRLRSEIGRIRRLAIGQLFDRFSHLVEERASSLGKRARLEIMGGDVELDSEVMERLVEPLTHLVQNALHHGLEMEEERLAAGKSRAGTLRLEAQSHGRSVRLQISDDGRGIDLETLRSKAKERAFIAADVVLDEAQTLELLFLSGLSTEEKVSTGAGRGVGMDAVRQAVTALGGRLEVQTRAGEGSRFTIEVPATLLISEALLVRIGGRRFALPLPAVDRLLHIDDTLLAEQEGARFLDDGGAKVELITASERLGMPPGPPPAMPGATGVAVRLSGPHRAYALEVEEVFATSEVVIKSLGDFLSGATLASGAFVDGDGDVVLLLDPQAMIEAYVAHAASSGALPTLLPGQPEDARPTLLLADDSISVRRVLGRRLEKAGYRVLTARDGVEALDILLDEPIDGLVSDLEMPHVSGDALIRRLRRRERWRDLPILVVTGRSIEVVEGADLVFHKPVPEGRLEEALETLRRSASAVREVADHG